MELISTLPCKFGIVIYVTTTDQVMLTASINHLHMFTTLSMSILIKIVIVCGMIIVCGIVIVNFFLRVLALR